MESGIFREKSIKRVSSPEQLNDYVKVSRASVWLVLFAIAALLIGVCVWGVFGHLDVEMDVEGTSAGGVLTCYVDAISAERLSVGDQVTAAGQEYSIGEIGEQETVSGVSVCRLVIPAGLPDGTYTVHITVERIRPMSFVLN